MIRVGKYIIRRADNFNVHLEEEYMTKDLPDNPSHPTTRVRGYYGTVPDAVPSMVKLLIEDEITDAGDMVLATARQVNKKFAVIEKNLTELILGESDNEK